MSNFTPSEIEKKITLSKLFCKLPMADHFVKKKISPLIFHLFFDDLKGF